MEIDSHTTGFLYAVSGASTTGSKVFGKDASGFLKSLNTLELRNPVLTGFNITDAESFREACRYTRGGIIGSAFIKHLSQSNNIREDITAFIQNIRKS
jgi:tryptophan synthase alpha chain